MTKTIDPAMLALVPAKTVGPAAMQCIDALQRHETNAQIVSTAFLFLMMCKKYQIHPGTVLGVATNLLNNSDDWTVELKAVQGYIKDEWT